MKRTVEIEFTNEELVEALFNKSDSDVAEIISLWKRRFDQMYEERKAKGEAIWIFDLNHFMMHVIKHMDEDGKDFIRASFGTLFYNEIDTITARQVMYLSK